MALDFKKKKPEFAARRLIPKRKYPKPLRFVGVGIVIMIVVLIVFYRIIVC